MPQKASSDQPKRGRPPTRPPGTEDRFIMRIDRDLKDELRGAAEALREKGLTMTAIVEQALRRELRRLSNQHRDGRPFPKRPPLPQPKRRSP